MKNKEYKVVAYISDKATALKVMDIMLQENISFELTHKEA